MPDPWKMPYLSPYLAFIESNLFQNINPISNHTVSSFPIHYQIIHKNEKYIVKKTRKKFEIKKFSMRKKPKRIFHCNLFFALPYPPRKFSIKYYASWFNCSHIAGTSFMQNAFFGGKNFHNLWIIFREKRITNYALKHKQKR